MLGCLYWYFEAIRRGYVHAKWNAGSVLVEGKEVPGYRELGMKLIEQAADAGENSACLFVAECYRSGIHGKKKNAEAASYWERRAWDYKSAKEFDVRGNLLEEYPLLLTRPTLQLNSGGPDETAA